MKYDIRLYVTIYGVAPLRVYLHRYAFARFASEAYEMPAAQNLRNFSAHFTKFDDEDTDEFGGKRSLGAILRVITDSHGEAASNLLMQQMKDAVVKTVISGAPKLAHLYRFCQPACLSNAMCF